MMTGVRAFATVVGIIMVFGAFLLTLLTLGAFPGTEFLGFNFAYFVHNFTYTALGLLILVVGVLLIALAASGRGVKQREAQTTKEGGNIVSFTEIGEVRISFKAVESMVLAAARKVNGIREVTTRIDAVEQGLIVYMRVKTIPDIPIPALVGELQTKVRDYVQENSGTNISEVKVLVENIAQDKIQRSPR
jgi:uncharacterized alkaline shock family protein YloU